MDIFNPLVINRKLILGKKRESNRFQPMLVEHKTNLAWRNHENVTCTSWPNNAHYNLSCCGHLNELSHRFSGIGILGPQLVTV